MTENVNNNSDEISLCQAFDIISKALEQFIQISEKESQPTYGFHKTAEEIFRGYGIKVSMQNEKGNRHNLPHIHIENGRGQKVSFGLDGSILAGHCDKKTSNRIKTFITNNCETLQKMWQLINAGQSLKPLKQEILTIR